MQMREFIAKIYSVEPCAIPAEVRLAAGSFSLESAYGSVKPSRKPESFDKIARRAKDAKAEETARELKGE